jgi:hypothetical protein
MASSSEIEKLERRYAENPDGRFFAPLADAYRKAGQVDRALELVRAGLQKHPDYLSAHIVLGRCLLDKGSDPEATATFQSVLSLDGENIIALKSLAEIAERAGRVDEARGWLQKLLAVDSMNAEAEADLERLGGALAAPAAPAEEAPSEIAPETSFADVAQEIEAAPPVAEAAPAPVDAETTTVVAAAQPPTSVGEPAPVPVAGPPAEEPTPVPVAGPPAEEPAPESTPLPVLEIPEAEEVEPVLEPPRRLTPEPLSLSEMPTEPMEALPLELPGEMAAASAAAEPALAEAKPDIHPLPSEARVSSEALDVMPFDDSLEWGTGERSSRAIRAEDVEAVVHDAEVRAPAVEFMQEIGLPATEETAPPSPAPEPAAAAPGPSFDQFSIEPPPDQSLGGIALSEPETVELPANLSGAYSIVDEVPQASPPLPRAAPPPAEAARVSGDLPLIMPEDVTPPEELARPSAKMVQMVSPPPREEPAAHPPMVTETMGDLYLKQGFRSEAAEVYRSLLAQRPDDAGLAAKLRAAEGPPPDLRAASLGAESVGTWLKRVAGARLSVPAPAPRPEPPAPNPEVLTPLESAFMAEPEGEPAHPAPDACSLDQIFGSSDAAPASPAPSAAPAPAPPPGASFDEFFGAPGPAPPEPAEAPKRPSQIGDEDLTAFSAWLQGLKK